MIDICAPKVTTFVFTGRPIQITGDSSQIQNITMNGVGYCGMFHYALTKLHSIALNLQALTLLSSGEVFIYCIFIMIVFCQIITSYLVHVYYIHALDFNWLQHLCFQALDMPMSPKKFLHLRHLEIHCSGIEFQRFNYLYLVFFLQACPVLESFVLSVSVLPFRSGWKLIIINLSWVPNYYFHLSWCLICYQFKKPAHQTQ